MTKVYAVAESVPGNCWHLTAGKRYRVLDERNNGFLFSDNDGDECFAFWSDSYMLDGGNWTRIEEEAPTPEQSQERAVEAEPIETAPKDGTYILIWRDDRWGHETTHVAHWDEDYWQIHDGKHWHILRGAEPSRWMPLPPLAAFKKSEVGHD